MDNGNFFEWYLSPLDHFHPTPNVGMVMALRNLEFYSNPLLLLGFRHLRSAGLLSILSGQTAPW
jgi:hypothetical protein